MPAPGPVSILLRLWTKICRTSELSFKFFQWYYVKLFHSVRFNLKCESPRFSVTEALLFLFTYGGSTSKVMSFFFTAHTYFVKNMLCVVKKLSELPTYHTMSKLWYFLSFWPLFCCKVSSFRSRGRKFCCSNGQGTGTGSVCCLCHAADICLLNTEKIFIPWMYARYRRFSRRVAGWLEEIAVIG